MSNALIIEGGEICIAHLVYLGKTRWQISGSFDKSLEGFSNWFKAD
jgi:hypothetical protein